MRVYGVKKCVYVFVLLLKEEIMPLEREIVWCVN